MRLQIDQSGKIEQTNKKTVLCLSNKEWYALVIPGKVKRQVQEVFRRHGQIRNFILFTFCAGIALLLQKARQIDVALEVNKWLSSPGLQPPM